MSRTTALGLSRRYGSRTALVRIMEPSLSQSTNLFLSLLKSRRPDPLVVAHRGDSFHAPENTLEAARLAWQTGAAAWELDVQLTRDGVPVLLHDQSLLRTTDVARRFAGDPRARDGFRVSDFDIDEVETLDAGSWFVAADGGRRSARAFGTFDRLDPAWIEHISSGSVFVPTLAEALDLTNQQDWLVNVEIKSYPDRQIRTVRAVLDTIAATGTASRVVISSFDHQLLADADHPHRAYALGVLKERAFDPIHTRTGDPFRHETAHVAAEALVSIPPSDRQPRSSRDQPPPGSAIEYLKSLGMPILVYTVNDHGPGSLAEHLAEIGVDGLFTDDPQGMIRNFEAA